MRSMSPGEYRHRADDCDRLAVTTESPYVREMMLYLAFRWRRLAQEEEAENNGNKPYLGPQRSST